jgi:hypothetical protein
MIIGLLTVMPVGGIVLPQGHSTMGGQGVWSPQNNVDADARKNAGRKNYLNSAFSAVNRIATVDGGHHIHR